MCYGAGSRILVQYQLARDQRCFVFLYGTCSTQYARWYSIGLLRQLHNLILAEPMDSSQQRLGYDNREAMVFGIFWRRASQRLGVEMHCTYFRGLNTMLCYVLPPHVDERSYHATVSYTCSLSLVQNGQHPQNLPPAGSRQGLYIQPEKPRESPTTEAQLKGAAGFPLVISRPYSNKGVPGEAGHEKRPSPPKNRGACRVQHRSSATPYIQIGTSRDAAES